MPLAERNTPGRTRIADLTPMSERFSAGEVAQIWFRWGREKSSEIHVIHPNFPKPGPDGLYLREQVREWFKHFHGWRQGSVVRKDEEDEALRRAQHGRGSHSPSAL